MKNRNYNILTIMETNKENPQKDKGVSAMRATFGIIMVVIYIGMGYLLCAGFFNMIENRVIALVLGILFFIYGIWRGYRLWRNWP